MTPPPSPPHHDPPRKHTPRRIPSICSTLARSCVRVRAYCPRTTVSNVVVARACISCVRVRLSVRLNRGVAIGNP